MRTKKSRRKGGFFCSQGVCTRKQPQRRPPFHPPPDRYQHISNQSIPVPKRKLKLKGITIG